MKMEDIIKNACEQSINGVRKGDTPEEVEFIQNYLKSAGKIVVPTRNKRKINVINQVLREFGLPEAKQLPINTSAADLNRFPAITKVVMALDRSKCNVVIARGRLGVPGSGSLLVIADDKGRILTATSSPSHVVHKKILEEAVHAEITRALERVGLKRIT